MSLHATISGELPDFKLAANSRRTRHWSEQAKATAVERERWTWLLKPWGPTEMVNGVLFERTIKVPVTITFGFRFKDKRRRDIDGFAAATKPLLDAMADLAWIYDDSIRWVKGVTYTVLEDGEPRTEVTVVPLEP